VILIEEFIAQHDHLSLEMLDKVLDETRRKERELHDKQRRRRDAEGIDMGVINECERIPVEKRSELEQRIATSQQAAKRLMEQCDIDEQLQAQLDKTQTCLAEWQQIRDIFTSIYPEASTSPRLSRSELEQSPRRYNMLGGKSKSSTSLSSSLSSLSLVSPRRLLNLSGNRSINTSGGAKGETVKKESL
jgi:hypothetical protein